MLKSEPSDTGSWVISGIEGSWEAGSLDSNRFHVVSLFGARPLDVSILQAFPNIPARPYETAKSMWRLWVLDRLLQCWLCNTCARFFAISQRVITLLSTHILQRESTGVNLPCLPFHFIDGSVHFGSIRSFNQDSSLSSRKIPFRVEDRALAKAGRALDGMNLSVGWLSWQT